MPNPSAREHPFARNRRVVAIDSGGHRERVLKTRDALVLEHLDMVPPIASRLKLTLPPSFELADLIAEGNFGLIRAATRYRPRQHGGTPFSAFARPRIRGAMLDSVRRRHWHENTREPLPRERALPGGPDCREQVEAIDGRIDERRLGKRILEAVSWLTPVQQSVVHAFFSETLPSMAVVGAALGLSEYRIGLEKAQAITELRRRLGVA
jgi:RNA polymerase sigma factor (sigma-70 family)